MLQQAKNMNKVRLLIKTFIFLLIISIGIFSWLKVNEKIKDKEIATILIAQNDINANNEVKKSDFTNVEINIKYINSDIVTDINSIHGLVAIKNIKKGTIIYKSDFINNVRQLKDDEVVFAIHKSYIINVPDTLRKNDIIHISIITPEGEIIDEFTTQVFYVRDEKNREVTSITEDGKITDNRDLGSSNISKIEIKILNTEADLLLKYLNQEYKIGISRTNKIIL